MIWTPEWLTQEIKVSTDRGEFYVTPSGTRKTWSMFWVNNNDPTDIAAFSPERLCLWLNEHEAVIIP